MSNLSSKLLTRLSNSLAAANVVLATDDTNNPQYFYSSMLRTSAVMMQQAASMRLLDVNANTYSAPRNNPILAYSTTDFMDALKYFSYLSYIVEFQKTPNFPADVVNNWQSKVSTVFNPLKVNLNKPLNKITRIVAKPNTMLSDSSWEQLIDLTKEVRDILYAKKSAILGDPGSTADLRTYLSNIFTYFNSKSESSFKSITTKVGILKDPKLSSMLHVSNEKISSAPVQKYLAFIQEKTKRKNAQYLKTGENANWSAKDIAKQKELKKAADAAYKAKLMDVIRSSNEPHLPIDQVKSAMAAGGFQTWQFPQGFKGRVDEKGKLYTTKGKDLNMGLTGGKYIMNPEYDHKTDDQYYAKGTPEVAENQLYVFTNDYVKNKRGSHKAEQAEELESKIDSMQAKWRRDLTKGKPDTKLLGAMMEAMYQTNARIGSEKGETDGEPTYGLSSWLVKHVKLQQNGDLRINYLGKSGMTQIHTIKADDPIKKALIAYMVSLTQGKGKNDRLWETPNVYAKAGDLRRYSKSLGYSGSVHKIRHVKADQIWKELSEKRPLKKNATPKDVDLFHRYLSEAVGKALGHQSIKTNKETGEKTAVTVGGTAAKAYISPGLQRELFRKHGAPIPRWLEALKDN